MSRLAELIEELCPDGVEYRPLGEIADLQRGGGMPKKLFIDEGIPAIHYGHIFTKYGIHTKCAAAYLAPEDADKLTRVYPGDLVVANTSENLEDVGKGVVWLGDVEGVTGGHATVVRSLAVDTVFLSYYLRTEDFALKKRKYAQGTKVIELSAASLSKIDIPVPPLAVQREIVRILDQFTTLEAELEAELEARRTQYEHYRNHLLSYESLAARGPVEMVKLGAVSRISAGYGFPKSEQGCSSGEYPFYKVSDMNHPGNQVFLEGASNYLSGPDIRRLKMTPFPAGAIVFPKIGAAIATNKKRILSCLSLVDNNVAVCIPEGVDGKYLYYWLLEQDLRFVAHDSGAVPSIRKTDLEQLDVPVPSVAEQERIVEVLDRFNALVNDISSGLPAEIAARRAQYEHYRDRLLSFPEKAASGDEAP